MKGCYINVLLHYCASVLLNDFSDKISFYYFSEIEDLERSHVYLTDLIERMSIPVFSDIETALNCTRKAVQQVNHLNSNEMN